MVLNKKAYKCIFPLLFSENYNASMWSDNNYFQVIYGENQKNAVFERCKNDEFNTYWELKSAIRTKMFPELDLYSQEKSILLKHLTDDSINHLTHSLGVDVGDKCPDEFYRNHSFYYEVNEECQLLVDVGLMIMRERLGSKVYAVTDIGIEAVKTLLLCDKSQLKQEL